MVEEITSGMTDGAMRLQPKHSIVFPGERIDLVSLAERHLPLLVAWRNDPEIHRGFFSRPAFTLASQTEWFAQYALDPTDLYFAITVKDGLPIGTVSISRIDWQARKGEFGRFLIGDPLFRGRRYGREAALLAIAFARQQLGLRTLSLSVRPGNAAAIGLYRALGFVPTSTVMKRLPDGAEELAQQMTLALHDDTNSQEGTIGQIAERGP
ncbi:GNAT family N-acetyltransferase [Chelatococcus sp. GCM10030263]|uniref:GNAT family N-acetyltransferase n=1 Tax=Chelatococcus sp. GCM10030263 TaxID=3273387 RepID=UPI0036183F88